MSEKPETLAEVVARYAEAYAKREAGILDFLDDEGELKQGESYERYDEARADVWSDSHADLSCLLEEIKPFLG